MNEAMNTSVEQEQTSDAFLAGLEDVTEPMADQPGGEVAESGEGRPDGGAGTHEEEQESGGDAPSSDPASPDHIPTEGKGLAAEARGDGQEPKTGEETPEGERKDAAPTAWTIKHMGQERTMTAGEVTPELLQKGLDYDRVRGKYDEAKPVMELFSTFAQKAGMSVEDYVRHIRQEAHRASGMGEEEAKRTVDLEDREAAVQAAEAQKRTAAEEETKRKATVDEDLSQFAKAFPEVFLKAKSDPQTIPQSVWDEVNGGLSLTAAYSRYVVSQAQARIRVAEQQAETGRKNAANAARSTGSMKSAGADSKNTDPFLAGFGD